MYEALAVFFAAFAMVFTLAFQSLNVNHGHFWTAICTSFAASLFNLILLKTVPDASAWYVILGYVCGGPAGVACAMVVFKRIRSRRGE